MLLRAIFVSKADHYPPLVSKEVEVSLCLNFGEGSGWGLKEASGGGGRGEHKNIKTQTNSGDLKKLNNFRALKNFFSYQSLLPNQLE